MRTDNGTDSMQKAGDVSVGSGSFSSRPNESRYARATHQLFGPDSYLKCRGKSSAVVLVAVLFVVIVFLLILPKLLNPGGGGVYVKGRAQIRSVETAIELHNSDIGRYPPSGALDEAGMAYCGAMKLCEAVMGRDLLGFHPSSVFRGDGTDGQGNVLYPDRQTVPAGVYDANMRMRKGPYLPIPNANAYSLADLYGQGNTGPFKSNHLVLCDVWKRVTHQSIGKKIGMPILYYKADTSKTAHDVNDPNNPENIYNYKDNHALLALGVPGKPGVKHPLYENPRIFYEITKNHKIKTQSRPYRANTYVILSAGWDGLYGTEDDIANFDFNWKRK